MSNVVVAAPRRNGTAVPPAMMPYRQFVLWRLIQKPNRPKPDKIPFDPATGLLASVDNPATWGDYKETFSVFERGGYDGIGFVFTADDPFIFIDLDDCADGAGGWKSHAQAAVSDFQGAWEVSQSGKGLHGIGFAKDKARLANKRRKFSANGNRYECYTASRFIAFGGKGWSGDIGRDWSEALAAWLPDGEQPTDYPAVRWADEPRHGYDGPADDDELIRRALASHPPLATAGSKPTFAHLWNADAKLGDFYPDDGGQDRPFDHSLADIALANALAFWTGCNPVRMERLFNRSSLSRGDQRKVRLAIAKAIADPNRKIHSRGQRLRDDQRVGDDVSFAILPNVMTIDQAHADFVFISDGSHVASRSQKTLRRYGDAIHEHAASKHPVDTGKLDGDGRPVVKHVPVIKLWLESPNRLSAETVTWAPGEPEFCRAPERLQGGDQAYNLWTPPHLMPAPENWADWVKPFLQHVRYLIPNESESMRFLQWVGHIFQRPGELPHTCYLMVATQTGIGRGTLASILTRALRGYVAANMNIDALFGGFNGRISQKLLATVDEIREGNSIDRYKKAEAFKSKITEQTRALNPKYGAQSVEKNCCRWIMFSNHMDALPFDNNDRRVIVIENPPERAHPDWYSYMHALIGIPTFVAAVQRYFSTLGLNGFNPHEPAPINEAKRKALASLESETGRACREFAAKWPDDFATVADLRAFIGDHAPAASRALQHDIERAGMRSAGRIRIAAAMQTILIVRGLMTPDEVSKLSNASVAERIMAAQMNFRLTQA